MPALFTIETDAVRLAWSQGRHKLPPVAPTEAAIPPFGLRVTALGDGVETKVWTATAPQTHLFEQTEYTLLIQSRTGAPVTLQHTDPVLLRGLAHAEDARLLHGTLNFGSQVGFSRFAIEVDGRLAFAFEVEVYPSKLDYRRDYEALVADVEDLAGALVLDHVRPTFRPGAHDVEADSAWAVWLILLQHLIGDLEQALAYVAQHPQWGTERQVIPMRADRIRKPGSLVRQAVEQGRGRGARQHIGGGVWVHEQLPAAASRYTLDTPTHRWLAFQVRQIEQRLVEARASEVRHTTTARRRQLLTALDAMQQRLARIASIAPLQAAGSVPPPAPPLPLLTAPGYREAHQACLHLRQGLNLHGDPLELGLKDLHLLYEYWCFLMLVGLLATMTDQPLPVRNLILVEPYGLQLRLRKGRAQTVRFQLNDDTHLTLTYNPHFGGAGYLVPQQPDFLLTLMQPGSTPRRFVVDAKYRLDASAAYQKRYGIPGPPAEALNDLHRYRDAIRDAAYHRTVEQAVALYPWRETDVGAYATSRHAQAVQDLGIGAIPLLPGATDALEAWLRGILTGHGNM